MDTVRDETDPIILESSLTTLRANLTAFKAPLLLLVNTAVPLPASQATHRKEVLRVVMEAAPRHHPGTSWGVFVQNAATRCDERSITCTSISKKERNNPSVMDATTTLTKAPSIRLSLKNARSERRLYEPPQDDAIDGFDGNAPGLAH